MAGHNYPPSPLDAHHFHHDDHHVTDDDVHDDDDDAGEDVHDDDDDDHAHEWEPVASAGTHESHQIMLTDEPTAIPSSSSSSSSSSLSL